jgi:hypothetical protein
MDTAKLEPQPCRRFRHMKITLKPLIAYFFLVFAATHLFGCSKTDTKKEHLDSTKLIYFGLDDHAEKQEDSLRLIHDWGKTCSNWQSTISERDADYKVLFGVATVTIVGRRGEVIYNGGIGPLYLPHGNQDGSGVNICKLTE